MERLIKYVDSDIRIRTETKIDDSLSLAEFPLPHFNGEVERIELPDINCETTWAKILLKTHHSLYVGAFLPKGMEENIRSLKIT